MSEVLLTYFLGFLSFNSFLVLQQCSARNSALFDIYSLFSANTDSTA